MSQNHAAANQPMFNERGLLNANIPAEADIQASMLRQPGQSFEQWMASRVARFETRRNDWDALKFQADYLSLIHIVRCRPKERCNSLSQPVP